MNAPEAPPVARSVAASITTMTEYVLPVHANALGSVFGGQILAWIDLCAAICAQRHARRVMITAGIDELSFERPVKVGQVVRLEARVTAVFRTSLEIRVVVDGEDGLTGESWPCVRAFVTFVAVDDALRPVAVPPVELVTDDERRSAEGAAVRRKARLARRAHDAR